MNNCKYLHIYVQSIPGTLQCNECNYHLSGGARRLRGEWREQSDLRRGTERRLRDWVESHVLLPVHNYHLNHNRSHLNFGYTSWLVLNVIQIVWKLSLWSKFCLRFMSVIESVYIILLTTKMRYHFGNFKAEKKKFLFPIFENTSSQLIKLIKIYKS